jgi:hypothetical protein
MDWEERVLPSIGNEVVKSVVAQYNAEQLLTQREKVRQRCILQLLNAAGYMAPRQLSAACVCSCSHLRDFFSDVKECQGNADIVSPSYSYERHSQDRQHVHITSPHFSCAASD